MELSEFYLAGQILEILIGERIDNKFYRAQVTQTDHRTIILHVPGFDPLRFVDLLKGTSVRIRVSRDGRPHFGASRLAQHFKDSSPYLVVQRPSTLEPIVRNGIVKISTFLKLEYSAPEVSPILKANDCKNYRNGKLYIHDMPEPFDIGTHLSLNGVDSRGKAIHVEGCVSSVMRDPDNPSRYAMFLSMNALNQTQKDCLLDAVLHSPDPLSPEGGDVSEDDE